MNHMGLFHKAGWAALVLAAWQLTGFAAESVVIGKVVSLEGDVQAFDAQDASRTLALESDVALGERIVTGPGSSVNILLDDESIIAQGERSEIILDEYVYKPEEKKGNAFMRATRGVFRVITGKITELNPEEFKVRSGLATIGIRGCQLGLRIAPEDEDIYILELPEGHSIHIEREDGSGAGAMSGPGFINVIQQGIVVSIRAGGAMTQRSFAPTEVMRVFQSLDAAPLTDEEADPAKQRRSQRQAQHAAESLANVGTEAERNDYIESKAKEAKAATPTGDGGGRGEDPQPPENLPPPTQPPSVRPPSTKPPSLVGGHPEFNGWEWGLWEDGNVTFHPNRYAGAEFLNREDVSRIVNGSETYHLSGSGQAGATIFHKESGGSKVVTGSASLNVEVGGEVNPTWGGSFDMSNGDGDRVAFTVDPGSGGMINQEGRLILNPEGGVSSYSMRVNDKEFEKASLSHQSVEGKLIKPGANNTGISAAAGEFHFAHGSEATVDGAFGVDFNQNLE